jgi:hypothetical protein
MHPINIVAGLPYVTMRPYTDHEWDSLPHVIWTGDTDWDPSVLDHTLDDDANWFDTISDLEAEPLTNLFDERGNYRKRVIVQNVNIADLEQYDLFPFVDSGDIFSDALEDIMDSAIYEANCPSLLVHQGIVEPAPRLIKNKSPDYEALRPFFGWLPTDVVKKTFEVTTQYACMPMSFVLKKRYKSPHPALNIHRRNKDVATDTVFSDTPAIYGGETCAQIFYGTTSHVTDVEPMKAQKQFVNALEDNITKRGAPNKLISDSAQVDCPAPPLFSFVAERTSPAASEPLRASLPDAQVDGQCDS